MTRFKVCLSMICLAACLNSYAESENGNASSHSEQAEWGYGVENGPVAWGQLSPEYALCAVGMHQSPIDLVNPTSAALPAIAFNYQPTALRIQNNGHTIVVASSPENSIEVDNGHTIVVASSPENSIEVDSTRYELLQFHFHAPSEHTVAGQSFAMEMHLVHQNEDGALAVIGVLIERGGEHTAFNSLWAHLPSTPGAVQQIEQVAIDAGALLPSARSYYRYDGSLTTPPCSEGVQWFVLTTPIELSEAQIATFAAIVHGNNRPVQPLNGRQLLVDVQ